MLKVRCKECGEELVARGSRTVCCGCPNMTTINGDKISANDLSKVLMIDNGQEKKLKLKLTSSDMEWQESRKKRKIRKLDFDIR